MKKTIALILTLILTVSLCGCMTQAERELKRAQEAAQQAQEQYEKAKDQYDQFQQDIQQYTDIVNGLR